MKKGFGHRFQKSDLDEWLEKDKRIDLTLPQEYRKGLQCISPIDMSRAGGNDVMAKAKSKRRQFPYGRVYLRKGCKHWTIDYQDTQGNRIQKVVKGCDTENKAWEALIKAKHGRKQESSKAEDFTFEQYAKRFLKSYSMKRKDSWRSDKKYLESRLIPFFGTMQVNEIKPEHVLKFVDEEFSDEVKKSTINRYLQLLRRMMNVAQDFGYEIKQNPVRPSMLYDESQYRRDRVLSEEEESLLLNEAAPHLKAILKFALQTGCRLQEILSLKKSDISLSDETITIRPEVNKTKKLDVIPMSSETRILLEQLVEENQGRSEFVFTYYDRKIKKIRQVKSIKVAFGNACKRANITAFQFRDCRRTYASRLHEQGVDPLIIQRLLRHSSFKISEQVYIQSNLKMMKEAVSRLSNPEKNTPQTNLFVTKSVTFSKGKPVFPLEMMN